MFVSFQVKYLKIEFIISRHLCTGEAPLLLMNFNQKLFSHYGFDFFLQNLLVLAGVYGHHGTHATTAVNKRENVIVSITIKIHHFARDKM